MNMEERRGSGFGDVFNDFNFGREVGRPTFHIPSEKADGALFGERAEDGSVPIVLESDHLIRRSSRGAGAQLPAIPEGEGTGQANCRKLRGGRAARRFGLASGGSESEA